MSAPLSPVAEEFFSPKTTAELDKSLGDIEELLLDPGDGADGGHSQHSSSKQTSTQKSLTDNNNSTNYYMSQDYSSWNAVHMQVQDNAKLPTFNLPVDRSNATLGLQIPAPRGRRSLGAKRSRQAMTKDSSTLNCPLSPLPKLQNSDAEQSAQQLDLATSDAIDEILRLSENDMNLSELFLDHDDRSSAALAYSSSIGRPVPQEPSSSSLEEEVSAAVVNNVMSATKDRPILPYKRKRPLPIPSPPREKTMAAAFATAAAIASTSSSGESAAVEAALSVTATIAPPITTNSAAPAIPNLPNSGSTAKSIIPPPGKKVMVGPVGTKPAPPPQPKPLAPVYRGGYPYPVAPHSAAHAKTKGSIAYATAQRSQFGFGGDHKVPSVPAPPPVRTGAPGARIPPPPPGLLGKPPPYGMPRAPPHMLPPLPKAMPKDVGSTIAYERKKQRAKDARIRLNDAIEELAVAIDLAGAQSKERFTYLTNNGNLSGGTAVTVVGSNPTVFKQNHLASLMNNTMKEASNAKKWDRPSFVALSASMLMSLNAQCEGLMKEVARLKGNTNNEEMGPDAVPSCVQLSTSSGESNSDEFGNSNESNPSEPAAKKAKVDSPATICALAEEEQRRCDAIRNVTETSKLVQRVASFLDPSSLCRCLSVAKSWSKQNIFQDQDLWLNHCIKRFGATAVRKWQDFEDDEDDKQKSASPNLDLYCRMAERNVKPPCSLEGSAFMGGASLDGLVSGWVSLMERSNGETSRSVMLNRGNEGKRCYGPIPVIELRILLQNTGYSNGVISFPEQQFAVDASTRRKGEKMMEVCSDERFKKRVLHIEKRGGEVVSQSKSLGQDMCSLGLFEYAILSVHIHARGCSTAAKFCNRAKKVQLLVSINGTTRPLVIPFYSMNGQP
ncbi:hypothetical protein QTG54_001724 [Skeletonema marinoi]|uniref:F-box domain-containing protein n=1 Tax=Skeletonema marinoi TaxID=267567 RepID=A0AAD9DH98_9STRA|nr:hypothetical protein QTG54_001724 [Skeletonema marinoi]